MGRAERENYSLPSLSVRKPRVANMQYTRRGQRCHFSSTALQQILDPLRGCHGHCGLCHPVSPSPSPPGAHLQTWVAAERASGEGNPGSRHTAPLNNPGAHYMFCSTLDNIQGFKERFKNSRRLFGTGSDETGLHLGLVVVCEFV